MRSDGLERAHDQTPAIGSEERHLMLLALGAWIVVAVAVAAVALLLTPLDARVASFWGRLLWIEFLVLVVAASSAAYMRLSSLDDDSKRRIGGVTPSISIAVTAYACLSAILMFAHAALPGGAIPDRAHLVAQIVLFTCLVLLCVLLLVSRAGARAGIVFDESLAPTPHDLRGRLMATEARLSPPVAQLVGSGMRTLGGILKYSLSENSSTSRSPEYQDLARALEAFCRQAEGLDDKAGSFESDAAALQATSHLLISRARSVSENLVKR
jgi:hypothetical protein